MAEAAKEFGYRPGTLRYHKEHHLPYRPTKGRKPALTTEDKLKDLEFEFSRLKALAEAGEKIDGPLRVLVAQRSLLELMLRKEGALDATHRKLLPPQPMEGEYTVIFENGKPRTVAKQ